MTVILIAGMMVANNTQGLANPRQQTASHVDVVNVYYIEGYVRDARTQAPIANVVITAPLSLQSELFVCEGCETQVPSPIQTDGRGYFRLRIDTNQLERWGLGIEAYGYARLWMPSLGAYVGRFESPYENIHLDILLEAIDPAISKDEE